MKGPENKERTAVERFVEACVRGNLVILFVIISLLLGAVALLVTPREEEPQIVVPLADVYVQVPGASAQEVEEQVATRLEKLLYQIDGVEYVYSMSRPGLAIVTVRFYVGEDREDSLIKIYNKVQSNMDYIPSTVAGWVVKPVEIDDVPIVIATLWSENPETYDTFALRRLAEELEIKLQQVKDTNITTIVGGEPRKIRVKIKTRDLAAYRTTVLEVANALKGANVNVPSGSFSQTNSEILVDTGTFLETVSDLKNLVVNVNNGRPVYLKDVADINDGPAEPSTYSWIGFGPASGVELEDEHSGGWYPAVNISVAKKKGTNAVWVARSVQEQLAELAESHLPSDVKINISRDYGETANDKVNELMEGLAVAIIIVIGLIAFTLGLRVGIIVALAVPITFALTLIINYLLGYTINRVTLFALTLALGLVVDDPIVDVENIYRHFAMRKEKPLQAVLTAMNEVIPPIILGTLAVIVSFIPLFFISGMMGPYMRPMALNVPLSMFMSLVVALTITPWITYHLLKGQYGKTKEPAWELKKTLTYRIYSKAITPYLNHKWAAWSLLAAMVVLMFGAVVLGGMRMVPLKMLPFDNKNEFQIVVDMPEGSTLEMTDGATRGIADTLRSVPEVKDFQAYVGTASPMDFNGLVRHYYLRQGPNNADIRVNLVPKDDRVQQSHEIALRLRRGLEETAAEYGAKISIVELPPGPPVIATVAAEVYGKPYHDYSELIAVARQVEARLALEDRAVDVDISSEDDQEKWIFVTDKEKAALSGVATSQIAGIIHASLGGMDVTNLKVADEVNPVKIELRLPRPERSSLEKLKSIYVKGARGQMIQIGSLGEFKKVVEDKTIYHKNLERVVYVFGEMAGRAPAEAILDIQADLVKGDVSVKASDDEFRDPAKRSFFKNGAGIKWTIPEDFKISWSGEGEWNITLDVFRDLGLAFAAACFGIYILLVYQTSSYFMPLILMTSIPLTIIGIMPGFWLLNVLNRDLIGGFPNPIFFTATAMIGMIALSGIAVRNAILLIEFVHEALAKGMKLKDALVESGAVRFRPIFLTAGTAMLAAWPITLDPIFSGLAWALIFGLFVSTAFTLLVVPTVYWMVYEKRPGHGLPRSSVMDD